MHDHLSRFAAEPITMPGDLTPPARPRSKSIDVQLYGLTPDQAYALAELCKRIGWDDVRSLAVDDDQARLMIVATDGLRDALEQAGVIVR